MAQFDNNVSNPMEEEDVKIYLAQLMGEIEGMKATCVKRFEGEEHDLKGKLSKVRTKNISIQDFDISKINAEKEGIKKSLEECRLRRDVFLSICSDIEKEATTLDSASGSTLISQYSPLRAKFDRECQRYEKGFPIYSERLNILNVIEKHQTCILIGETGSGKSTQLVQYLCEDGYAENGLIACTQPRKLAASSLAQHVSSEVGETIGQTYGFASVKSKLSKHTKVVFMTDHTLLNECIADRNLSRYSCLVIDEAHERSIHTDILIALIKRCLPNRQDLKVIITSATINPTLFSTYFGGLYDCPVIEVSGRTYPVDVHWELCEDDSIVDKDYVADSVSKAYEIHVAKRNEPGDILVFLTGPGEIERACKLAQETLKTDATVLPLHGKLQPEEQQKVFEVIPGKRKVVFSTNVAETSVTIPGIKYVIDTGLAKEMCYDSKRNMNTLEIRPISKSSANQRKGRAGRTSYGECYRLYSQEIYASMRDDSVPEILRITLAFAVIKLYEFGIEDIHSFEFVDAPDKKALSDAVENLKFLGAIEEGKLTELGRKMALLPLEPNLSKILIDSIDKGLGTESAAAVAISTLSGRVFFRPSKEELMSQSDHKKLPFCSEAGDQMTHLNTYFQWLIQDKSDRSKWCAENFVNGKSMKMVEHMVEEILLILKQNCGIDLPRHISSLDNALQVLPRLFFDSHLPNLSVHLGHDRIGYWCASLPDEQLVLHYGSSLRYLSLNLPKYVVFEKTQKTSQHFLLQVLPVPNEWIEEAVASGRLPCHPSESSLYQFYKVSHLSFSRIGPTVMFRLRTKYIPDRRAVIHEFSEFEVQPLFDYPRGREHGDFKVYAQECYLEKIKKSVESYIQAMKEELRKELKEDGIVDPNDDVKIVLGEGGMIQQILMSDEFRSVVIQNINSIFKFRIIEELKKQIGDCNVNEATSPSGKVKLFVTFKNSSHATAALSYKFVDSNAIVRPQFTKNRKSASLSVTWPRRERKNFAYINFSEEDYYSHVSHRFGTKYFLEESSFSVKFQHDRQRKSIKVMRIGPNVTEEYVKSKFLAFWPMFEDIDIHFQYQAPFEEDSAASLRQKQTLEDIVALYVPRTSYELNFITPSSKAIMYRAIFNFDSSAECHFVKDRLNQLHSQYQADMSLTSSVKYRPKLFLAIESSLKEIASNFNVGTVTFDQKDKWGNCFVKVTAKTIDEFTQAKEMVSKIIEPTIVTFSDVKFSQYTSTVAFYRVIQGIQNETSTFMKLNNFNMRDNFVEIYGSVNNKALAEKKIQDHLAEHFAGDIQFFEIHLKEYKPGLMKHLVQTYGAEFEKLLEEMREVRAIKLDSKLHILILFSTETGYKDFEQLLSSYEGDSSLANPSVPTLESSDSNEGNECCVCSETHESNKTFYRLEICGHVYCRECVEMQLSPTAISFPIKCAADKCEQSFVWKDFESLLRAKVIKLQALKSAALKDYVAKNPNKYHSCSTPDCDMVYAITEDGARFVCGQCGAHICTGCHGNWHEGYATCSGYKNRDNDIDNWLNQSKDRKKCPKCSVPIEKIDGCMHIACRCGAHICWTCLAFYNTSDNCYKHLRSAHGGYY